MVIETHKLKLFCDIVLNCYKSIISQAISMRMTIPFPDIVLIVTKQIIDQHGSEIEY